MTARTSAAHPAAHTAATRTDATRTDAAHTDAAHTDATRTSTGATMTSPTTLVRDAGRTAGERPALRLLPTPSSAPPYDDEVGSPAALHLVPAAGTRAPAAPPRAPAAPARRDGLHRHHARPAVALPPADAGLVLLHDDGSPRRTATAELPPPRPVAHALVQRLLEVSAGVRPVTQLRPDTTPQLFEQLERALLARPRATGLRPSRRDVRSVHVQDRPDGVAEVCATVVRGRRIAAIALRLEGVRGRWLCTQLVGV